MSKQVKAAVKGASDLAARIVRGRKKIPSLDADEENLGVALAIDGVAGVRAAFYTGIVEHHMLPLPRLLAHRPWILKDIQKEVEKVQNLALTDEARLELLELALQHFPDVPAFQRGTRPRFPSLMVNIVNLEPGSVGDVSDEDQSEASSVSERSPLLQSKSSSNGGHHVGT